jgi:hypothetical protein
MHSGLKFGEEDDRWSIPKTGKTLKTHHVWNASKVVMGCYGSNQSLKICLCFHDRFSEQVQPWVVHLHTCSNFWGKSSCWKSKFLRTSLCFADMQFLFFPLKIWWLCTNFFKKHLLDSLHLWAPKNIFALRATLDKGPSSWDQWIQAILLVESFKLIPRPLDESPRQKSGKLRPNLHMAPVLEGKSIGSDQKTVLKGELLIWRAKNQARDQGTLRLRTQFASN